MRFSESFWDDPYEPTCCGAVPCQWAAQGKEPCKMKRYPDGMTKEDDRNFNRNWDVTGSDIERGLEAEREMAKTRKPE
jgi:hypothetical protein